MLFFFILSIYHWKHFKIIFANTFLTSSGYFWLSQNYYLKLFLFSYQGKKIRHSLPQYSSCISQNDIHNLDKETNIIILYKWISFFSKVDLEEIMNRKDLKPESRKYSFSFIKKNKYYSNNIISHNIPGWSQPISLILLYRPWKCFRSIPSPVSSCFIILLLSVVQGWFLSNSYSCPNRSHVCHFHPQGPSKTWFPIITYFKSHSKLNAFFQREEKTQTKKSGPSAMLHFMGEYELRYSVCNIL